MPTLHAVTCRRYMSLHTALGLSGPLAIACHCTRDGAACGYLPLHAVTCLAQVLARAKEQVAALERFGVPFTTAVTREKLLEAHKMLQARHMPFHIVASRYWPRAL